MSSKSTVKMDPATDVLPPVRYGSPEYHQVIEDIAGWILERV